MATSAIYEVIDTLVDTFAALAVPSGSLEGVLVLDGLGVTEDPGDFLMIGADDPDADDNSTAASSQQEWAHANHTARDEVGTVTCVALSWNGDGDQRAARASVKAITAAVEDALRANPSLGLASLLWTSYGESTDLVQAQGEAGAAAQVTFTIAFRARLT